MSAYYNHIPCNRGTTMNIKYILYPALKMSIIKNNRRTLKAVVIVNAMGVALCTYT